MLQISEYGVDLFFFNPAVNLGKNSSLCLAIMTQNCGKCDKVFYTKSDLDLHLLEHENKSNKAGRRGRRGSAIPCGDCSEIFFRRCDIRLHRRMVHQPQKITCEVCGRHFSSERRLKMHYQFHNVGGEYECFYCMKEFNKGWKLKIHLLNHSGRAPYICQYCDEDFLYPGKILGHLKREHDVYYACKDCGEAFETLHEQDEHLCKLYGCKDCKSSFCTAKELGAHAEFHNLKIDNGNSDHALPSDKVASEKEIAATTSCEVVASSRQSDEIRFLPPSQQVDDDVILCESSDEIVQRTVSQKPDNESSPKFYIKFFNFGMSKVNVKPVDNLNEQLSSKQNQKREVPSAGNEAVGRNKFYIDPGTDNSRLLVSDKVVIDVPSDSCIPLEEGNKVQRTVSKERDTNVDSLSKYYININLDVPKYNFNVSEQINEQILSTENVRVEENKTRKDSSPHRNIGFGGTVNVSYINSNTDTSVSFKNEEAAVGAASISHKQSQETNKSFSHFKMPTSGLLSKRFINILKRKPEFKIGELNFDQNSIAEQEQTSLKSWLTTSNNSQCVTHDFVFDGVKEPDSAFDYTYKSCKIKMKKEEYDMSFEDLCQF